MPLRRLLRPISRGKRGAGALEYALLIFVVLVAGFLAWKFLGGSVSGSTKSAETKFNKGGDTSGQTAAGGGDQGQAQQSGGGGGGGTKPTQGSGGPDRGKSGTPGGAGVATVQKPGTGGPVEAKGSVRGAAAEEAGGKKPKNWLKYFMIALLVVGLMAAVYTFGKKKSTA